MAARAGVSTATVSRTLAAPDLVSDEARARVLAAIKATGYTPNMAARNLRARRSMMVLVVVPNIANAFFAEVLRGIDDELVENGYGIIIGNLDNRREREARYVDLVFAGQVDAVLLMSGRVPAGNGRLMSEAGLPLATICVDISESLLPFDHGRRPARLADRRRASWSSSATGASATFPVRPETATKSGGTKGFLPASPPPASIRVRPIIGRATS